MVTFIQALKEVGYSTHNKAVNRYGTVKVAKDSTNEEKKEAGLTEAVF